MFVLYVYNWSGSQKVFILRNLFYRILFGSSLVDRDLPIASNGFTTVVLVELIFKKFLYQPDIFYDFNQSLTWYLASQTKCPYVFESYHLLCDNPHSVWKQWFYFPSPGRDTPVPSAPKHSWLAAKLPTFLHVPQYSSTNNDDNQTTTFCSLNSKSLLMYLK